MLRTVVGSLLLWGSAAGGGYAVAWTVRSHLAAERLAEAGRHALRTARAFDASTSCRAGDPGLGQLAGVLEIPVLALTAPVEQGESDSVLSSAVGHDPASAWPGEDGTAVLAAHDVSYFSRIGGLRPGDRIVFVTPCRRATFSVTGHRIVPAGSLVANSRAPSLVLDTCWPSNALWWTPDRELVMAREVGSAPTNPTAASVLPRGSGAPPPLAVPVPAALAAQGLTLATNTTLLGTMKVVGRPSPSLVQSPVPLDVEASALTAWYGILHSLADDRPDWFAALAPGLAFPAGLAGYAVSEYLTRLSVVVRARGDRVLGATLAAGLALVPAGVSPSIPGDAARHGRLVVQCTLRNGELLVAGWSFRR
ncbi:MAG TPA: class D sortase [Acidimicrobiales bacterium]|nr:class D sortase [Acidimicrobiales bacterium]